MMNDPVYRCIAYLISIRDGISISEANDILDEVCIQCESVKDGSSLYPTIAFVIDDYLDLGPSWSKLFSD